MPDTDTAPAAGFLTAREALALLAYGDVRAFDGLAPGEPDMFGRWGHSEGRWTSGRRTPPLFRLRWVLARVRWRLTRGQRRGRWRACPLPPLGPVGRAQLRHLLRTHGRPAADLVPDLRADIERARLSVEDVKRRLGAADTLLRAAAADGRLPIWGRRGRAAGGQFASTDHEPVPPAFFLHRHRTLAAMVGWATLGSGPDVPMEEWALWRRSNEPPDWGDLRFPKGAVLALVEPPDTTRPAPQLSELPAQWTLLETLAWIMFRDPAVVRDASPETPRPAASHWAEVRVPGREAGLASVTGAPGYSLLRLTLRWQHDAANGQPPPGRPAPEAQDDLLTKLRSGALVARGRGVSEDASRAMDPGDWRGLILRERERGNLVPEPDGARGRPWRDVTLTRDDIVRVWPAAGYAERVADSAPATAPLGIAVKPTAERHAVAAWYVFRVRTWPKDAPPPTEADDLAAARAAFAPQPRVSRDTIREIRREKAPPNWRKTGPRSPP